MFSISAHVCHKKVNNIAKIWLYDKKVRSIPILHFVGICCKTFKPKFSLQLEWPKRQWFIGYLGSKVALKPIG